MLGYLINYTLLTTPHYYLFALSTLLTITSLVLTRRYLLRYFPHYFRIISSSTLLTYLTFKCCVICWSVSLRPKTTPRIFLDASTHLYKRLCLSVCPSVGGSVRPSVRRFSNIAEIEIEDNKTSGNS